MALPVVHEVSAGGLVVKGTGAEAAAALIGRRNRRGDLVWSLPKGHVEAGETVEATAVREVEEETGIRGEVRATLGTVAYWFVSGGSRVHKTVHHFLLVFRGGELSDADVEVSAVEWVPLTEVAGRLEHADERELVSDVPQLLRAVS